MRRLVGREAPVHTDGDGADPGAGELDLDISDAVAGHQRDPVAPPDPAAEQHVRDPVHPRIELRVGQAAPALDQRGALAVQRGGGGEQAPDGRRRGRSHFRRRRVVP